MKYYLSLSISHFIQFVACHLFVIICEFENDFQKHPTPPPPPQIIKRMLQKNIVFPFAF